MRWHGVCIQKAAATHLPAQHLGQPGKVDVCHRACTHIIVCMFQGGLKFQSMSCLYMQLWLELHVQEQGST